MTLMMEKVKFRSNTTLMVEGVKQRIIELQFYACYFR